MHKNIFRPSPSYYFFILLLFLTNLARALQHSARKQHNVNTHTLQPILANKQPSPRYQQQKSPAKIILQKLWQHHLTVCKQISSGLFKVCYQQNICLQIIYMCVCVYVCLYVCECACVCV